MRVVRNLTLSAAFGATFYLLLIDTTSLPELYVLAGVAVLAGLAFEVSRQEHMGEASIALTWLARAWKPIASVPPQIVTVTVEAFAQLLRPRPARGEFRAVPFRGGESERDEGRRAMAEAWGSLAPNTIVLGIDEDRELMLVHQLRPQGAPEELDVVGLG